MAKEEFVDEFGFYGPMPISSAHRTIPKSGFPPGLDVGGLAPNFHLKNQFGDINDFHEDRRGSKAALLLIRSDLWRTPCLTHLRELQKTISMFRDAGIKLYAVSYDEQAALQAGSLGQDIEFTLLSDPEARVIRQYGVLNTFIGPEDDF